jgi:hypothetical protein
MIEQVRLAIMALGESKIEGVGDWPGGGYGRIPEMVFVAIRPGLPYD